MGQIISLGGYETLADIIRADLDLLFVGYNPSIPAIQRRHYYGNPRNRFWEDLHEAGFVPEVFRGTDADLRILEFGLGLTDVVKRPSPNIDDLTRDDFVAGFARLDALVRAYRPRIVCFVGKGLSDLHRKLAPAPPQGIRFERVPSTSPRNNGQRAQRLEAFRQLKRLLDAGRTDEISLR